MRSDRLVLIHGMDLAQAGHAIDIAWPKAENIARQVPVELGIGVSGLYKMSV
jgi:hypothetical protein